MAVWDDIISQEDLKMFAKGFHGGKLQYGKNPAILVIDMTYGFVEDAYPLGCSKMGWPAVKAIKRLLDTGRQAGIPIFFTKGKKRRNVTEMGRWKSHQRLESQITDPKEYEIVEEIKPRPVETEISKISPSGFFGTPLASLLTFHNVDTVIVTGMTTSGCVRATVVDAFSYNFIVIIPEECVGDRGIISHKVSLFDMHMKYADVLPLSEVVQYIDSLKS